MPNPKASTLYDSFPTVTLGAWWTQRYAHHVTGAHPGAQFPSPGTFFSYGIVTTDVYDLNGSSVTLQWGQLNDLDADVFFFVSQDNGSGVNFSASLFYQPSLSTVSGWSPGNTIPFSGTIQGGSGIATYSNVTIHFNSPTDTPKYWRIRCDGGAFTIYIEYSTDGSTWSILNSQTISMSPDGVTAEIDGGGGSASADSILIAYNAPLAAARARAWLLA